MTIREQALKAWLNQLGRFPTYQLIPLAGDASFRSYYRLQMENQTWVVMDAPPDRENCVPFIAIANALRELGLKVPEIIAQDVANGFLLLTDFGDRLYLKTLTEQNARTLYGSALSALQMLQGCHSVPGWTLPTFTSDLMLQELAGFKEWFLRHYLNIPLTKTTEEKLHGVFDWLIHEIVQQPYVFMHRDYHSANLMVLPNQETGILDFQDAFVGPLTYDVVSLLRDCYITWPENLVNELGEQYWLLLQENNHRFKEVSKEQFFYWLDVTGMERHLKALMTFSRKYKRDQNPHYLQHIPRTLQYLLTISQRYAPSYFLTEFIYEHIEPRMVDTLCVQ